MACYESPWARRGPHVRQCHGLHHCVRPALEVQLTADNAAGAGKEQVQPVLLADARFLLRQALLVVLSSTRNDVSISQTSSEWPVPTESGSTREDTYKERLQKPDERAAV